MERLVQIFIDSFIPLLTAGIKVTIPLAVITFVLGTLLAVFVAIVRINRTPILAPIADFYVWIIRGTPLLVQLFIVFFGLPKLGVTIPAFPAAIITFTMSVGAYSSEIIRSAIQAVPKGQWEAAEALSLNYFQTMTRIVIPQATKIAIPPLSNSFISLVKDTSLAASITVTEMFLVAQRITATTYEPLLLYIEVAIIYLMFSTVLNILQNKLEKKFTIPEEVKIDHVELN